MEGTEEAEVETGSGIEAGTGETEKEVAAGAGAVAGSEEFLGTHSDALQAAFVQARIAEYLLLCGASSQSPGLCGSGDATGSPNSVPLVLLVEDNFYYKSMRYSFFQIARRHGVAFAQVFLVASAEVCLQRNRLRMEAAMVPADVILQMASHMEFPVIGTLLPPLQLHRNGLDTDNSSICADSSQNTHEPRVHPFPHRSADHCTSPAPDPASGDPLMYSKHNDGWQRNHTIISTEGLPIADISHHICAFLKLSLRQPVPCSVAISPSLANSPSGATLNSIMQELDVALRRTAGDFIAGLPRHLKTSDIGRRLAVLRKEVLLKVRKEGMVRWLTAHGQEDCEGIGGIQAVSAMFLCMSHQLLPSSVNY